MSEHGPLLPKKETVAATIGFPVTRRNKAQSLDPKKRHSSEYDEAYNKSPIIRGKAQNMLPNHDEEETVESAFEEDQWENLNYKLTSSNIVTPITVSSRQRVSSKVEKNDSSSVGTKFQKSVSRVKRERFPKNFHTKE